MKRSIIMTIIGISIGLTSIVASATNDSKQDKPIDLDSGYYVTSLPNIETTTTTMSVITTPPVDISVVNSAVESNETLTVDEMRQLYGNCGEWHDLAIDVGFTEEEWPTLSKVIWKESRCTVDAWNGADSGLTQINRIHSEWLSQMGYTFPDDLFDPRINLEFAYKLYSSREEKGKCGWQPWSLSC